MRVQCADDPLPLGMPRDEISEYVKSGLYQRRISGLLSRRSLIFATGFIACYRSIETANALSATQAKELIELGLSALELIKDGWEIGEKLIGKFKASNDDPSASQNGNTLLAVLNSNERTESSRLWRVQIPRNSHIIVNFNNGPSAKTAGDKTFQVNSSDDSASTQFTAES